MSIEVGLVRYTRYGNVYLFQAELLLNFLSCGIKIFNYEKRIAIKTDTKSGFFSKPYLHSLRAAFLCRWLL